MVTIELEKVYDAAELEWLTERRNECLMRELDFD
jgi:hypothetical protein